MPDRADAVSKFMDYMIVSTVAAGTSLGILRFTPEVTAVTVGIPFAAATGVALSKLGVLA